MASIMQVGDWERIFLITNDFGKERFTHEKKFEVIMIDRERSAADIKKDLINALKDKLSLEVALNMESGTGKEHMAIIAALLSLGVGIRLVAPQGGNIEEV